MNAFRCAALATIVVAACFSPGCTKGEPVTLVSNVGFPEGLAVGGGTLYWADSRGLVLSVPTGGGTVTTVVSGEDTTYAVAVDDANLYWANEGTSACSSTSACTPAGSIVKRPLRGGASTTLATSQDAPQIIAVAGGNVFWVNQDPNPSTATGVVMQVAVTGGTPITLGTNVWTPGGIAADGTSVYWTDYGTMGVDGAIVKAPVGGGPGTTLAPNQSLPVGIAVDATSVYWLANTYSDGSGQRAKLERIAKTGGPVTDLAPSDGDPGALAVDGSYVYWSDGGDFQKVPVGGGPSQPFALGVGNSVTQFAQDAMSIYWVDQLDQELLSTTKSP